MAATYEAIANAALVRVGNKVRLGTSALTSPTSEPALSLSQVQTIVRDKLLQSFPWNFATRRRTLDDEAIDDSVAVQTMDIKITGSDGSTYVVTGNQVTITAASGIPFAAANTPVGKNIMEVTTGDGVAIVTQRTSDTVVIADIIKDFTAAFGAAFANGTANYWKLRLGPAAFGYDYRYALPSAGQEADYEFACLTVRFVSGKNTDYEYENGILLSNDDLVEVEYTAKITDPVLFDPAFEDIYGALWIYECAAALTGDKGMHDRMEKEADKAWTRAEQIHARESSKRKAPKWWHEAGG